jgi:hypothetical protein
MTIVLLPVLSKASNLDAYSYMVTASQMCVLTMSEV